MGKLRELFESNDGNLIDKWDHYIDIYERYFERYIGKELVILEIGIFQGGSLGIWKKYFGDKVRIIGIDVNEDCLRFKEDGIDIFIGSQEDPAFLKELKSKIPMIDILIDDGGHTMKQQITTFQELFSHVKNDGLYICEDTHTSYWMAYGGSLRHPNSFIERSKDLIDSLSKWHYGIPDIYSKSILGIHFYNSLVIFEKGTISEPKARQIGQDNNIKNLVSLKSGNSRYKFVALMILERVKKSFNRK